MEKNELIKRVKALIKDNLGGARVAARVDTELMEEQRTSGLPTKPSPIEPSPTRCSVRWKKPGRD